MRFTETKLPGVLIVDCHVFPDERGSFVPFWLPDALQARGLDTTIAQCSLASNRRRGTIRGLHYQAQPQEEVKLVSAIRGRLFDVIVDLRPESPTYRQWIGVELDADRRRMVYLPRGTAHGYQTLDDGVDVFYFVSAPYTPDLQRGIRWDDPTLAIDWPLGPPTVISDRDRSLPTLD
jgi:dTDP-4-dehydrorhamnose 3,5-epimerase